MLDTVALYYFSPTGVTEKVGMQFAETIAEKVVAFNLGDKKQDLQDAAADLTVVAMPVFAGRIPAIAAEKMQQLDGHGRKAVTIVVYGNRAYDDALLELNDTMMAGGHEIVASAAFIAGHSIVPEIAKGRPDKADLAEISAFAEAVEVKLFDLRQEEKAVPVKVPGNRPYREGGGGPNVVEVSENCVVCGKCVEICPTGAVELISGEITGNPEKCIECMACIAACPVKARALPQEVQTRIGGFLAPLKDVRKENETFL